jgi:hypothetical protein
MEEKFIALAVNSKHTRKLTEEEFTEENESEICFSESKTEYQIL